MNTSLTTDVAVVAVAVSLLAVADAFIAHTNRHPLKQFPSGHVEPRKPRRHCASGRVECQPHTDTLFPIDASSNVAAVTCVTVYQ